MSHYRLWKVLHYYYIHYDALSCVINILRLSSRLSANKRETFAKFTYVYAFLISLCARISPSIFCLFLSESFRFRDGRRCVIYEVQDAAAYVHTPKYDRRINTRRHYARINTVCASNRYDFHWLLFSADVFYYCIMEIPPKIHLNFYKLSVIYAGSRGVGLGSFQIPF